jgi:hypothetical protein
MWGGGGGEGRDNMAYDMRSALGTGGDTRLSANVSAGATPSATWAAPSATWAAGPMRERSLALR